MKNPSPCTLYILKCGCAQRIFTNTQMRRERETARENEKKKSISTRERSMSIGDNFYSIRYSIITETP